MHEELQNTGHYVDLYQKNQQTRGSYEVKREYEVVLKGFIKLYEMKYLNYYKYNASNKQYMQNL